MTKRALTLTIAISLFATPFFLIAMESGNPEHVPPCAPKKPATMAAARKVAQEKTWGFVEGTRPTAVHTFKHPVVISTEPVSSNPAINLQMLLEHPKTYAQQCAPWAQEVAEKADTTEQVTFVRRTQDAAQQAAANPAQSTEPAATPAASPPSPWEIYPDLLFHFPKLRSLVFDHAIRTFPEVDQPEQLEKLCLKDMPATGTTVVMPDVLSPLNTFTNLRALSLCFEQDREASFANKPIIGKPKSVANLLRDLSSIRRLKAFKLHCVPSDNEQDLAFALKRFIVQNKNLSELYFGSTYHQFPGPDLQSVCNVRPMRRLQLTNFGCTSIAFLNTEKLETLSFKGGILALPAMHNALKAPRLRDLCFRELMMSEEALTVFPLSQIQSLAFSNFSPAHIMHLQDASSLEILKVLKSRNFDPTIPHGQGNEPRPYLRCLSDLHHVQHENLQCILLDLYEESLAPLKEGLAKKPALNAFIKEIVVNGEKTTLEEALERAT